MGSNTSVTNAGNTGSMSFARRTDGSTSTVANATGNYLRIFYHVEKSKLEDLLDRFRRKADIIFIDLQPYQYIELPCLEEGFASIFVADPEDSDAYGETICLNVEIPRGACCIVTASNEVRFRKCDGGIWIDEDGYDHCPQ